MNKFFLFIIVFTTIISLDSNGQTFEKMRYKGYIRDGKNKSVQYAAIQNIKTGEVTLTDLDGSFSISGTVGDTLKFRSMGYKSTQWIIPGIWNTMEDSIILKANTNIYALDEINVVRYYSYAHFKQAFKDLRIEKTEAEEAKELVDSWDFTDEIKEALLEKRITDGSLAISVGGLDKITRDRKEVKRLEEVALASEDFKALISRNNVKELTGYSGTCLDSFMVFLNTNYYMNYTMKEYDVLATILYASEDFLTLKGQEEWFSQPNQQ